MSFCEAGGQTPALHSERQRAEIGGPVELALALDILADDAAAHLRNAVEIIRIFGTRDPRAFLEFLPFECPLSPARSARRPLELGEILVPARCHMSSEERRVGKECVSTGGIGGGTQND